jgi:hypothetical protein
MLSESMMLEQTLSGFAQAGVLYLWLEVLQLRRRLRMDAKMDALEVSVAVVGGCEEVDERRR